MSQIRVCDKCGESIEEISAAFTDRAWVQVGVSTDGPVLNGDAYVKDYHRDCARTVTVAEVWARKGLVAL